MVGGMFVLCWPCLQGVEEDACAERDVRVKDGVRVGTGRTLACTGELEVMGPLDVVGLRAEWETERDLGERWRGVGVRRGFNAHNLYFTDVMYNPDSGFGYAYVLGTHPVMHVLRCNADLLTVRLDERLLWFRVDQHTFDACCNVIKWRLWPEACGETNSV